MIDADAWESRRLELLESIERRARRIESRSRKLRAYAVAARECLDLGADALLAAAAVSGEVKLLAEDRRALARLSDPTQAGQGEARPIG